MTTTLTTTSPQTNTRPSDKTDIHKETVSKTNRHPGQTSTPKNQHDKISTHQGQVDISQTKQAELTNFYIPREPHQTPNNSHNSISGQTQTQFTTKPKRSKNNSSMAATPPKRHKTNYANVIMIVNTTFGPGLLTEAKCEVIEALMKARHELVDLTGDDDNLNPLELVNPKVESTLDVKPPALPTAPFATTSTTAPTGGTPPAGHRRAFVSPAMGLPPQAARELEVGINATVRRNLQRVMEGGHATSARAMNQTVNTVRDDVLDTILKSKFPLMTKTLNIHTTPERNALIALSTAANLCGGTIPVTHLNDMAHNAQYNKHRLPVADALDASGIYDFMDYSDYGTAARARGLDDSVMGLLQGIEGPNFGTNALPYATPLLCAFRARRKRNKETNAGKDEFMHRWTIYVPSINTIMTPRNDDNQRHAWTIGRSAKDGLRTGNQGIVDRLVAGKIFPGGDKATDLKLMSAVFFCELAHH